MSINGISNPLLANLSSIGRPDTSRATTDRAGSTNHAGTAQTEASSRTALRPQAPIAGGAATQHTVPAEAPPGTDPAMWSVLTAEERSFFAKTAALGPLTYGRIKAASHPAPPSERGVRLDVRA